ncbi:hypothetical protein S245_009452, partial [Arachis hypogaea]
YRLTKEQVKPLNGLDKVREWIESHGLKRAAVTNAPRPNAELMISLLDNHFPFLLSQSLISRHFTQFRRVNLLVSVEFAVDEEALPPFHQFLRFLRFSPSVSLFLSCSLSLSSISCRGNLVAIHAGNRGYPPNKVVCTEGPDKVRELIAIGASFDHGEDGNLHLVREGGHSHCRIVHAADMTGKEIERALLKSVVNPNIFVFEHHLAINLLTCQKKTKIKPKSNPSDNHFPFLLSQSLISRHFTQFRRVNLLVSIEFAVDEEALPPFHQFLRFLRFSPSVSLFLSCSLSLSSISCRGNLVAIHAGNRGYPPNKVVCTEGPDKVRELIAIGASFDHGEDGNLHLVREGGHSHCRIVHAADRTGKEIERALLKSVVNPNIFVFEHHLAINLLTCQKKTKIKPKSNPSDNHFPFLLSQSLISRHFTQFCRVNLLVSVEFAVDEEALPPFHQFLRFLRFSPSVSLFLSCSLSLSSISCRGNLVAIHAGNRGYPPNKVVCTEGPDKVRELIAIGASFDHGEDGNLHLVREGGHSHCRIVHAADTTGKEIERALLKSVVNPNIFVFEHHLAINLLTCQDGSDITCVGIDTLNTETLEVVRFLSNVTLLASGGAGHIYPKTTNPLVATGDGIAMAHRAQAVISNME